MNYFNWELKEERSVICYYERMYNMKRLGPDIIQMIIDMIFTMKYSKENFEKILNNYKVYHLLRKDINIVNTNKTLFFRYFEFYKEYIFKCHDLLYKSPFNFAVFSYSPNAKCYTDFLLKYQNKLGWDYISEKQTLSDSFIEKYQDKINWLALSKNVYLSEFTLEKYQNKLDWDIISKQLKLSEKFMIKLKNRINWMYITKHQELSENFIERFQNKLNWIYISQYQMLSETFIRKHQDEVDWFWVSCLQKLSEEFIIEFENKVNWSVIIVSQKLSNSFKEYIEETYIRNILKKHI